VDKLKSFFKVLLALALANPEERLAKFFEVEMNFELHVGRILNLLKTFQVGHILLRVFLGLACNEGY
jgi:hypothetical protein